MPLAWPSRHCFSNTWTSWKTSLSFRATSSATAAWMCASTLLWKSSQTGWLNCGHFFSAHSASCAELGAGSKRTYARSWRFKQRACLIMQKRHSRSLRIVSTDE